jgi:hypothetical protein
VGVKLLRDPGIRMSEVFRDDCHGEILFSEPTSNRVAQSMECDARYLAGYYLAASRAAEGNLSHPALEEFVGLSGKVCMYRQVARNELDQLPEYMRLRGNVFSE